MIVGAVLGRPLPRPAAERAAAAALFAGSGEVARLGRELDWSQTPLGPVSEWPAALGAVVRVVLELPLAMCVLWGEELVQVYNDPCTGMIADKHPAALGQPAHDCWPEISDLTNDLYDRVRAGETVRNHEALYSLVLQGRLEDRWFDQLLSPLRDDQGSIDGILSVAIDRTEAVLDARRLRTLNALATSVDGAAMTRREAFGRALEVLERADADIPLSIGYLIDPDAVGADLINANGVEPGGPMAPRRVVLGHGVWPLARAVRGFQPVLIDDVRARLRVMPDSAQSSQVESALIVPLRESEGRVAEVLILGAHPRLRLDARYRDFLGLVGREVEARLAEAHGREREVESLEWLAEIDRAKTEFFSNVSDEFRTPLTLMLAPLEQLLRSEERLPSAAAADIELVSRNARRLLRLVDGLLDFSQLDAGRLRARPEPTDLAVLTAEIAGAFTGAAEHAGLKLRVETEPRPEPVWVDREMWEKILSNLLSNALKFTFAGEIVVTLRQLPNHAELVVRDTGVGIPAEELPHLFTRFHRVRGTRARTHEGAGIGLALVNELVSHHHGRIRVRSELGKGTTFTVWIRVGAPLRGEAQLQREREPTGAVAAALAEEAERWGSETEIEMPLIAADAEGSALRLRAPGARVLVVEDNVDMREYLVRLLSVNWQVDAARDGAEALSIARRRAPDLVLADSVMLSLGGLDLLQVMRRDARLRDIPVVLLTAHAGEESAIEGLIAGAGDYIAKPFSGRELVARVGAQLELARIRRRSEDRLAALIDASWDVVYRMSPDWTEMRRLDGHGFIADTESPSTSWLNEYIHPDDQAQVLEAIQRAIGHKGVFELEHRVRRPDGTLGWTLSRAVPLLDDNGEIIEWVGAARDVTARRHNEQANKTGPTHRGTRAGATDGQLTISARGAPTPPFDTQAGGMWSAISRGHETAPRLHALREHESGSTRAWRHICRSPILRDPPRKRRRSTL